jgi:hypothetical protein
MSKEAVDSGTFPIWPRMEVAMSRINDILKIVSGVASEQRDASGKIVEKVLKEVPLVADAASEAVKAAIKIITKK